MSDERTTVGDWPAELSLDERGGPAPYITRGKSDALIDAVLAQAGYAAPGAAVAPAAVSARRSRWAASSVAAVVLFVCAGMGSASAAVMWYVRERAPAAREQPVGPPQQERAPRRSAPKVERPAPARIELAPAVVESAKPRAERRAPEDWLVEGNRLRAERRWDRADEAYAHALRSAPHGQTAYVARVASAAVRLEHLDDAKGALALYRAALRQSPRGPLREEILMGLADAQRALGNRAEERSALAQFLAEYPDSPLAAQAKSRLE